MLSNTKEKGMICELECAVEFMKRGYNVSFPYGDNCKYDLIAQKDEVFLKVQCKKARDKGNGSFDVPMRSTHINLKKSCSTSYTAAEVDYIATVINGECYLIYPEECSCYKTLRFTETGNGQSKYVSMAYDYHIDKVLG